MKKLHGVKKMNKRFRKLFRKATNLDIPIKLSSDFFYFPKKKKITYTILLGDRADRNFRGFIKNFFGYEIDSEFEIFVLSVLHEIGHYSTYDFISEGDKQLSKEEAVKITNLLREDPQNDEIYSRHFALPLEIIATTWAINFIEENPKVFSYLVLQSKRILEKFYNQNSAE